MNSRLNWYAATAEERGPVRPRYLDRESYNALGFHGGLWGFHQRIARLLGAGKTDSHTPDFSFSGSKVVIEPKPQWGEPGKVETIDPWSLNFVRNFGDSLNQGKKIFPSGAVNEQLPFKNRFITECLADPNDDLKADGVILKQDGTYNVTQLVMDQVWHLNGFATRVGMNEQELRQQLFEVLGQGEVFPQLVEDDRIQALLPMMGGFCARVFGNINQIGKPGIPLAMRLHDFCHDGDSGAGLCSCDIYRNYSIKRCIQMAQAGGVGITLEALDEGRGFGQVPKHEVYEMRWNHPGGRDDETNYFPMTEALMGQVDGRIPWTKMSVLHLLGIRHVDEWISMSDDKRGALEREGVTIGEQIALPTHLRAASFSAELRAKISRGYYNGISSENGEPTHVVPR